MYCIVITTSFRFLFMQETNTGKIIGTKTDETFFSPVISLERELIRDYFTFHKGTGFEFAYLYPRIKKVFQEVGRVLNSENYKVFES